ncbi:sensor histidine kinase [Microbacteriaceae bacterium VKM Ac-2855]|nr:sensor histidine kinase [Microbacteriaceae bacterium VKM Ac-2855]
MSATAHATDPFADGWVRRAPTRINYRRDALAALVLFAVTLASVGIYSATGAYTDPAPLLVNIGWAVAMTLPLAARRRFPASVAIVAAVAFYLGQSLRVPEMMFNQIALFLAIYTLGAWGRDRRVSVIVRILIIVGMFAWLSYAVITSEWTATTIPSGDRGSNLISPYAAFALITVILNLMYFGGAYLFGESARQSARRLEALEARTAELDDERERSARQAVALERIRIARELHDVVAHHVSVMGVQAGAARRVLARDPERAVESLTAIEQNARTAVDELHRMLVALRSDDVTGPLPVASDAASTRGLDQLEELAAETREAGLPVVVQIIGEPRSIPATIGLSLFRVAQESLTNARKHAGAGAQVDLRVRYLDGAVEVEVSDHGGVRGRAESAASGGGLGQIGMRERMAAVGGVIEMRPNTRGGYLVRARVPLPETLRADPLPSEAAAASRAAATASAGSQS